MIFHISSPSFTAVPFPFSGLAFSLAAPLMAVELLVPLTAVAQLATAFLCGVCLFQERSTVMQQLGFVAERSLGGLLGTAGDC